MVKMSRYKRDLLVYAAHILSINQNVCADIGVYKLFIGWDDGACPAVEPFGALGGEINTAVTTWCAKIVMPVRTVKRDATFGDVEYPGHAGQVVAVIGEVAGGHVAAGTFIVRHELAVGRIVFAAHKACAGGCPRRINGTVILEGDHELVFETYFDTLQKVRHIGRGLA